MARFRAKTSQEIEVYRLFGRHDKADILSKEVSEIRLGDLDRLIRLKAKK